MFNVCRTFDSYFLVNQHDTRMSAQSNEVFIIPKYMKLEHPSLCHFEDFYENQMRKANYFDVFGLDQWLL